MPALYTAQIVQSDFTPRDVISDLISVRATRAFNQAGALSLTLPDYYDFDFFRWNERIVLWRSMPGNAPQVFGDTHWFVRKITRKQRERVFVVEAVDAFSVLNDRIVAYTSETFEADKTLEEYQIEFPGVWNPGDPLPDELRLDNMMRAYMRENYGEDCLDTARIVPEIYIGPDENAAPWGEKKAGWAEIGGVLTDLARQSEAQGYPLYYDLVPRTGGTYEFMVWNDVRNADRGSTSLSPLVLSDVDGTLADAEEIVDYSDVGTYCYSLGYDSGNAIIYEERQNVAFVDDNPFSRVEFTITNSDADDITYLQSAGDAALQGRRPKRRVTARVADGAGFTYGVDYVYGDKVVAEIFAKRYDCLIDAVKLQWENGVEGIEIRLSGEEFVL